MLFQAFSICAGVIWEIHSKYKVSWQIQRYRGNVKIIWYKKCQFGTYFSRRKSPLSSLHLAFFIVENNWIPALTLGFLQSTWKITQVKQENHGCNGIPHSLCDTSLQRDPISNLISIWQLLSLWEKSLISSACQGKIYNGVSRWLTLDSFLRWLDARKSKVCHLGNRGRLYLLSRGKPYCFSHTQLALSLSEKGLFYSLLPLPHALTSYTHSREKTRQ